MSSSFGDAASNCRVRFLFQALGEIVQILRKDVVAGQLISLFRV